jgi:hypothetical protein
MGQLPCLVVTGFTIQLQTVGRDTSTGIGAVTSDRTLQPAQLALDGIPQVLDQVEAVGDLLGLRGTLTRCIGVKSVTTPGD